MHPFIHAFTPAIDPPWEAKTDFDAFHAIARSFSDLARTHLGHRKDLVSVPLLHDTPGRPPSPAAWSATGGAASTGVPGKTMPTLQVVERDYTAIADKLAAVGPLADKLGFTVKNVTYRLEQEVTALAGSNGVMLGGAGDGRPAIDTDGKLAEAILTFSGTTNGALAVQGFRTLEKRVGKKLADLAEGSEEKRITFADTQAAPVPVITSPEWSGLGDRRTALRAVHRQHRTAQAVAHPDRADALLPRPRLDERPRRGAADLPAAAGHAPALRRARARARTAPSRSPSAT